MANKHMKRCSTAHIISKMQITITMRYHLMPVRMFINKNSTNNKCWRGCGENGNNSHCWWECKLIQPLRRTVWRFLKTLKIEDHMTQQSYHWHSLGENHHSKRHTHPNVNYSTIYNSQDTETI